MWTTKQKQWQTSQTTNRQRNINKSQKRERLIN